MNDRLDTLGDSPGPFAAFQFREFRLYWTSLFISNIGSWMQITATSWLLYDLTGSAFQLGLNGVFRAIPTIGLSVFGGTVADRYDRRRLILFSQIALMLLAFLLGFLAQTGIVQAWHIYVLTSLNSVVGTLDGPARQALLPSLVPRWALPNAIAFNSILWKGTVLVGPALAGVAIATVGTDGAFYANGLSFLAVIGAVLMMKIPLNPPRQQRAFAKDFHEGLAYVFSHKIIVGVMGMEAASSVFGLDQAMLTIFARDVLQVGASGLGFLQSARGLGGVLGSGLLIFVGQHRAQGTILLASALLYSAAFAWFGISYSFPLSLTLLLIVGATDTIWGATRNTILQVTTAESMRGRVMGIFQLSSRGLNPLGQTETGLVVPLIGAREATFVGGLIVGFVTIATIWRIPALHRFRWVEMRPEILRRMGRPGGAEDFRK
ncbi:MAG: MFS transporter [Candidatus Binatia bacterium]